MQRFSSHLLLIRQPPYPPFTTDTATSPHPAQWHLALDSPPNVFHIPFHLRLIGNLELLFFFYHFLCSSPSSPLSVCCLPFLYHLNMRDRQQTKPPVVCVAEKWERNLWNQARPLYWFICMQEGGREAGGFIGTDDLGFMFHTSLSQSQSHSAF